MKYTFILALLLATFSVSYGQKPVKVRECVIDSGVLKQLEVEYNPANGERSVLVKGVRKEFYSVYPKTGPGYADGQSWYVNNETIQFDGSYYVKYGLPRVLGLKEIEKDGEYKGVGVYIEAGWVGKDEVIYIPVRQGCEFQPYQWVCGSVSLKKTVETKTTMQIKATVAGFKGKLSYEWSSGLAKIIKGQGTATVTVDFSGMKGADNFDLSLIVKDAANCKVEEVRYFEVKK